MISFDFSAFERQAARIGLIEKEVPFALANAMTRAAQKTKDAIARDTWPSHVKVQSPGFIRRALEVDPALARDFRAGKGMRAAIYAADKYGYLQRLAVGGIKRSAGGSLAIPSKRVKRNSNGAVLRGQKPRNLKRTVRKGDLIFQAEGKGKNSKLRLMYAVRPQARINAQVPFYSDFQRLMRAEVYKAFLQAVQNVIKRNRLAGR